MNCGPAPHQFIAEGKVLVFVTTGHQVTTDIDELCSPTNEVAGYPPTFACAAHFSIQVLRTNLKAQRATSFSSDRWKLQVQWFTRKFKSM